ncbi:hypothetical protein TNCV_890851 [Trichonephila clavipes]|nr:hypothetical protein TNCV_890851 [Trichonephila clavipes]
MTLADCFSPAGAYQSSPAVVVLGRPHPNLSNSFACGLERFPSARNDTFVDSEICSYTGDGTPLLQLSDHSSTSEVVRVISSSHISRTESLALAANMLNCVCPLFLFYC